MSKVSRVEIQDYDECEELLENIQSGSSRSTCGALVVKVNEFIKKPAIEHDLTGILSNYLGILQESGVYIKNGIFNLNFAEAALLLQGSVQLYGKKVDLLWDDVIEYLRRNMSYEEKTEDNKDQFALLEERKAMFKRKRKVVEENTEEQKKPKKKNFIINQTPATVQGMSFNDFQTFLTGGLSSHECDPYRSYDDNWVQRSTRNKNTAWEQKVQHGNNIPAENSDEARLIQNLDSSVTYETSTPVQYDLSEVNMYGEWEPIGDYGNSSVFDELSRDIASLHRQVHQYNIPQTQAARSDVQEFVLRKWMREKSIRIDQVYAKWDDFREECAQMEQGLYQLKSGKRGDLNATCYYQPPESDDTAEDINSLNIGSVGDMSLHTPLGHSTPTIDNGIHAEEHAIHQELSEMMGKRNDPIRTTMDSDIESGVFDSFSTSTPAATPVKCEGDGHTLSMCEGSEGIGTGMESRSATPLPSMAEDEPASGLSPSGIDESVIEEIARGACQIEVKARKKLILDDDDFDDEVKPKRSRRIKERERPVITANLDAFNKFLWQHYTPSTDEGELEPLPDEPEEDDDVLGDLPDLSDLPDMDDSTLSTSFSAERTKSECDTQSSPATPGKSFTEIMGNDAATRLKDVLDWRRFITEKIGNQRKSDFDIHVEETRVIESIGEVGKTVHYKDICAGKTAAQVSHNFMATLHLANTHNVDITGIQRKKLSNDTLELKLLSTDRHHEHLDEYNAPSTEEKQERMVCITNELKRHQPSGVDRNKKPHSAKRVRRN